MKGPSNLAHMLRGESRENLPEEDYYSDEESHRPEFTHALLDVRSATEHPVVSTTLGHRIGGLEHFRDATASLPLDPIGRECP
jgi:hypothetical protein